MLTVDRVCVRCSVRQHKQVTTNWTNEHDHGLEVACTKCGLTAADPLSAEESRLARKLADKPVRELRRAYVVC